MVRYLKFLLISLLLIAFGYCGWWYILTPQPPGLSAKADYFVDTLAFQTRNFSQLPRFNNGLNNGTPSVEDVNYWLPMARSDNRVAQIFVARYFFADGATNPPAYQQAILFLVPASEQGIPVAQNALGVAYRLGLGVPQDKIEAYKWFYLAASSGLSLAEKNMYDMASNLSESDITAARLRANAWIHGDRRVALAP